MEKLIALALAFSALVAFASAHTIITTTIEEENYPDSRQQCSQQIQGERLNQCQRYLRQQGQRQSDVQSCCQELRNVHEQCQCEAVKEAFRQAQMQQQQQQQQGGSRQGESFSSQQLRQMREKAQDLPNQCNLQSTQCQIGTVLITTTTTITEENTRGSQQQCQHIRGRQFNQCQNFIQQQMSGSSGMLMMRQGGQSQEGLQQCCNELQNVEQDCQCEAMQEVYRQVQQQQQQQGGRRGGQPQMQDLQQMVQNLRNQCGLQVQQQCRIPSAMF